MTACFDIFAWIVLLVLVASTVARVLSSPAGCRATSPRSRGHPWAQAVTVAGWVTLFFGFVLWPLALIWAYVDVPARREEETPR